MTASSVAVNDDIGGVHVGTRTMIALLAIGGGAVLAVVLFVPFVARQYRRRGRLGLGRSLIALAFLIYLLALAGYVLLPLPDDITGLCARGGVPAQLRPLYVVGDIARQRTGPGLGGWLSSPPVLPLAYNVALFVPLGLALRHLFHRSAALTVVIGLGVSLLIECTQLTGNWFLFPCAYRQFNVDDLIANTLGAALGALLAPLLRLIDPPAVPSPRPGPVRPVTARRRWLGMACDWLACSLLGTFLATALPGVLFVLTGHYPDAEHDPWYRYVEPALGWWLPGLLLFALPALLGAGGSTGQRAVLLRPVRPDGTAPSTGQRLTRLMLGSGLYALLGGLAEIEPTGLARLALAVFVLASVVAVLPTRRHRGLSPKLTGLEISGGRPGPESARGKELAIPQRGGPLP